MNTRTAGHDAHASGAVAVSGARRTALAACLFVGLLIPIAQRGNAAAGNAALPLPLSLGSGSVLWLEGTSTIHDFQSKTTQSSLTLSRDPNATLAPGAMGLEALIRGAGVCGLDLEVPVLTLHSERSGLDKNLWKTIKASEHPTIRFHLAKYSIVGPATADTLMIHAFGTLSVAGVERPDTLDARAYHSPQGVWLTGSESLLMSSFGIKPPKMMLGTLRVADPIVVRYRLLLAPKSEGASSPSSSTN